MLPEPRRCENQHQLMKVRDDLWKEYCFAKDFANKSTSHEARKHYYTLLSQVSKKIKEAEELILQYNQENEE